MDYLQYNPSGAASKSSTSLVLNLIINGLPSILRENDVTEEHSFGFKPYYKWITFNIKE